MKIIKVSDEVYEFLKSCQYELTHQDNRITANPIFGFKEAIQVASYDPQEYNFVSEDHTNSIAKTEHVNWEEDLAEYIMHQYDTVHDVREFLSETFTDTVWSVYQQYTNDDDFETALKNDLTQYIRNLENYEYENFAEEVGVAVYGYEKTYRMYEESVSFFESDLQAHLSLNKHNMKENFTYVFCNTRTPKMTQLREILIKGLTFEE